MHKQTTKKNSNKTSGEKPGIGKNGKEREVRSKASWVMEFRGVFTALKFDCPVSPGVLSSGTSFGSDEVYRKT